MAATKDYWVQRKRQRPHRPNKFHDGVNTLTPPSLPAYSSFNVDAASKRHKTVAVTGTRHSDDDVNLDDAYVTAFVDLPL